MCSRFNTVSRSKAWFFSLLALNCSIKSESSVTDLLQLLLVIIYQGAWILL